MNLLKTLFWFVLSESSYKVYRVTSLFLRVNRMFSSRQGAHVIYSKSLLVLVSRIMFCLLEVLCVREATANGLFLAAAA